MDLETYQQHGLHKSGVEGAFPDEINGRSNMEILGALAVPGDRQYHPCPEAIRLAGQPRGDIAAFEDWDGATVYADTLRDLWIYTTPGFDPAGEAPALVYVNDGGGYLDENGAVRAAAVLDNLHAAGEITATVGVFVMPGRPPGVTPPSKLAEGEIPDPSVRRQRSLEYDTCNDRFATFIEKDGLPFVTTQIGCQLDANPQRRTICGISSGGICAFTAAWHRPDLFGCVLSHCGSFTAIRGGHNYQYLIRVNERRPIRVCLTSGKADADILFGSWPQANQAVAASLEFAGYDVSFHFGEGGHSLAHGGAIFADTLRWLWEGSDAAS